MEWYLSNMEWVKAIKTGEYRKWSDNRFAGRCFKPEKGRAAGKKDAGAPCPDSAERAKSDRFWDELSKRRM